jgi:uncharacterized membrane protein required for colicin V production
VGVVAALRFTSSGEVALQSHLRLPIPAGDGVAFVAIFVVANALLNVVGALLSRLVHTGPLGVIDGVGGALFSAGKGAVVLAFLLLFLHLFPVVSSLDPHLMGSSIGRSLVSGASNAIRIGAPIDPANRT